MTAWQYTRKADGPEGMTILELRAFIAQCTSLDVPDNARVTARIKMGGRIKAIQVDVPGLQGA